MIETLPNIFMKELPYNKGMQLSVSWLTGFTHTIDFKPYQGIIIMEKTNIQLQV
jgi:hypothetical protein